MRTTLFALFILSSVYAPAQRDCATHTYHKTTQNTFSANLPNNILKQQPDVLSGITAGSKTPKIIRIPVVIHLVYQTDAQNISDAQIKSGMDALNRDFRKQNSDTANIPARFKHLAADVEIEFALATADPVGRPTTGIVRKKTSIREWAMDDKIKFSKQGGADAWDSKSYLNVWIGNLNRSLGYTSVMGGAAELDGIVITTSAFGTLGKTGAYNMGRTLVHETGHWLGLKHIWGDEDCGDDGVADTPVQAGYTSGCPTGFLTSCNNGATGDMYNNYMDFTNDACINMFTLGQKKRMRSYFAVGGLRYSILLSKGLNEPWVEAIPIGEEPVTETPVEEPNSLESTPAIKLYPNPTKGNVTISFADKTWIGKEIRIINLNGLAVQRFVVTATEQSVSLAKLPSGLYLLMGENGGKRLTQKIVKAGSTQ